METVKRDRLSGLPSGILYEILSHISLDRDGFSLVCTSKRFYRLFILELYKEAGRTSNWAPLFVGAVSGNLLTLKRCLEADAPLNCRWPRHHPEWWVLNIDEGDQPLQVAMMHYQVEAVEWMLEKGADPYEKDENGKRRTLELICESQLLQGDYYSGLRVAARWRHKRLHIPDRDVLALRGRKILDLVLAAGASHNPGLTRALQWIPDEAEGEPVQVKEYIRRDLLSLLPCEILLKVFSLLPPVGGGGTLVITSKFFYHTLKLELYKRAANELGWLPLFVGAMDGNVRTLATCLKLGAPVDHQWKGNHLTSEWRFADSSRPLHVAVDHAQLSSVKWLLAKGAKPWKTLEDRRESPQDLAYRGVGWPSYPDSKQALWWRQKDFTVPCEKTMREGYLEIWKFFTETIVRVGEVPRRHGVEFLVERWLKDN